MSTMTDLARDPFSDARSFYLQEAFRALLDAMARPGEIRDLPPVDRQGASDADASGLTEPALVVADVLIDAATGFSVAGSRAQEAERILSRRAHANAVPGPCAPYAFLPAFVRDAEAGSFVRELPNGTLADPQLGATLVVECATLLGTDGAGNRTGSASGTAASRCWTLTGPGIKDTASITCDRTDVIEARIERADEFPCGIDLILVDGAGHVAALPRTTRIERAQTPEGHLEEQSWDM